jgi:hypothetical protein
MKIFLLTFFIAKKVTAFTAKPRTLLFAFPHFRNEDENASINKWILYLVSRLETDSDAPDD